MGQYFVGHYNKILKKLNSIKIPSGEEIVKDLILKGNSTDDDTNSDINKIIVEQFNNEFFKYQNPEDYWNVIKSKIRNNIIIEESNNPYFKKERFRYKLVINMIWTRLRDLLKFEAKQDRQEEKDLDTSFETGAAYVNSFESTSFYFKAGAVNHHHRFKDPLQSESIFNHFFENNESFKFKDQIKGLNIAYYLKYFDELAKFVKNISIFNVFENLDTKSITELIHDSNKRFNEKSVDTIPNIINYIIVNRNKNMRPWCIYDVLALVRAIYDPFVGLYGRIGQTTIQPENASKVQVLTVKKIAKILKIYPSSNAISSTIRQHWDIQEPKTPLSQTTFMFL